MSDDNKNLSDDLNDMLGDAKEGAKKGAKKAADKAGDISDDAKDKAKKIASEAKETASEFADSAKETFENVTGENKKVLAGILGILFGAFGVHKFILGYQKEGMILLGITLISIPLFCVVIGALTIYIAPIIGLVEGIIYLTKSDEEFYNTYQVGRKPWF